MDRARATSWPVTKSTTFYLVRHGESEANAARRFAGQSDSPLTDRGRQQAEAVAEELANEKFDRIVSSDLSRTREKTDALAKPRGPPVARNSGTRLSELGR